MFIGVSSTNSRASPTSLNKIRNKEAPDTFERNNKQTDALKTIGFRVCSPPALSSPKANLNSSFDCDARDHGVDSLNPKPIRMGKKLRLDFGPDRFCR